MRIYKRPGGQSSSSNTE